MVVDENILNKKAESYLGFLSQMYKLVEWLVGSLSSTGGSIIFYFNFILTGSYTYANGVRLGQNNTIMETDALEFTTSSSNATFQVYTFNGAKSTFREFYDLCKETLVYIISNEDTFEGLPATADSILRTSQGRLRKINRWLVAVIALHCSSYAVVPLFSESEDCYLEPPGPAWLPLDCKNPFQYFLIYTHSCLAEWVECVVLLCTIMIRSTFSSLISVQCQVLEMYIESLGKSNNDEILSVSENQKNAKRCEICVKIYQKLQQQVFLIERIFSIQMLADILSAVTAGSLIVYKTGAQKRFQFLGAVVLVSLHLFFVCRMGENIHEKMTAVSKSCYQSYWYKLRPDNRKTLYLLMLKSSETKYVRAVKVVNSSYRTFEKVIRAGYTFLLFLFESHLMEK